MRLGLAVSVVMLILGIPWSTLSAGGAPGASVDSLPPCLWRGGCLRRRLPPPPLPESSGLYVPGSRVPLDAVTTVVLEGPTGPYLVYLGCDHDILCQSGGTLARIGPAEPVQVDTVVPPMPQGPGFGTKCWSPSPGGSRPLQSQLAVYCKAPSLPPPPVNGAHGRVPDSSVLLMANDREVTLPLRAVFQDLSAPPAQGSAVMYGDYSGSSPDQNFPMVVGNKGHYSFRVQEWVDCVLSSASSCAGDSVGPDGEIGTWQGIGEGSTDLYGPSATTCQTSWCDDQVGPENQAALDASVAQTVSVRTRLMHLVQPNYLRVMVSGYLGDTRPWPEWSGDPNPHGYTFDTGVSWNPGRVYYCYGPHECVAYLRAAQAGDFTFSHATPAFAVQVRPVGSVQLTAVPYTILYQPPGNQSWAQASQAVTEGTSYTVGNGQTVSNVRTHAQQMCSAWSEGVAGGIAAIPGYAALQLKGGARQMDCSGSSSTNGDVQSAQTVEQNGATETQGAVLNVPSLTHNGKPEPIATLLPGPSGAFASEPFWYDLVALDLAQPYLVFRDHGEPALRLAPVPRWPDLALVSVAQLAACAWHVPVTLPAPYGLTYTARQTCTVGADPFGNVVVLSPRQALSLARLDPFFSWRGQATDPSVANRVPGPGAAPRASPLGGLVGTCANLLMGCVDPWGQFTTTRVEVGGDVASTITGEMHFAASSSGLGLGLAGNGFDRTTSRRTATAHSATLTYSTSAAVSSSIQLGYGVTLQDQPTTAQPVQGPVSVVLYQDNVFGTIMFQDPKARTNPGFSYVLPTARLRAGVTALLERHPAWLLPDLAGICASGPCSESGGGPGGSAGDHQAGRAFRDLRGYRWAAPAIDQLARAGVLRGVARGRFDPAGLVTRAQYATLLVRLFHLVEPRKVSAFRDVPTGFWAEAAVAAAAPFLPPAASELGIFGPNVSVSRQDVAAAIVRILVSEHHLAVMDPGRAQQVLAGITDGDRVSSRLTTLVATAIQHHIMQGFPDGAFHPTGRLTRAQAAVLLYRVQRSYLETGTQGSPPVVTAIDPGSGPATGGTSVTIRGSGFTGATQVLFEGPAAAGIGPAPSFRVDSDARITAVAPPGPAGVGVDVEVVTPAGTSPANPPDRFTYQAAGLGATSGGIVTQPIVTGVTPSLGPASGGTAVTIHGLGFTGTTAVTFGGVPASAFTVVSDAEISALSPPGGGTVDVAVQTRGGSSGTGAADRFTYG